MRAVLRLHGGLGAPEPGDGLSAPVPGDDSLSRRAITVDERPQRQRSSSAGLAALDQAALEAVQRAAYPQAPCASNPGLDRPCRLQPAETD